VDQHVRPGYLHAVPAIARAVTALDPDEVTDTGGERRPAIEPGAADAGTGRGLLIVEALTETWGVTPRTGGPGKTVWAVLPVGGVGGTGGPS
jgi:hypothetical protein